MNSIEHVLTGQSDLSLFNHWSRVTSTNCSTELIVMFGLDCLYVSYQVGCCRFMVVVLCLRIIQVYLVGDT